MNPRGALVGLVIAVIGLPACKGGQTASGPGPGRVARSPVASPAPQRTTIDGTDTPVRGTVSVTGTAVSLQVLDNYFLPNIVRAPAGKALTVTLESAGAVLHNISSAGGGVDQDIRPGGQVVVSLTVPASGTAAFFCKYHRDESLMVGELVGS